MMLFNINNADGAAGIWTVSWVVAGRCGQTPNDAAGVRTHIEHIVFSFILKTWRDAALRFSFGVRPPFEVCAGLFFKL